MNMFKRALILMTSIALMACGGGGGSAGTSPFTTTPVDPTASSATSVEVLASAVQLGSGGELITISAIAKGQGNVSLNKAPVAFSADSGTLTSVSTATDANGVATAALSAGADKSNRNITVTVTSGAAIGKIVIPVNGTSLTFQGDSTVPLGATAKVGVKAVDSNKNPIPGLAVAFSSSLNNGLSASSATTDSQGIATVTYTAMTAGADKVSFSAANVVTKQDVLISADSFTFVLPAAAALVKVGTDQPLKVQYLINNVPQVGKLIQFTATAGLLSSPTATTDGAGQATLTIRSTTSSPTTVQATVAAAQASQTFEFVAADATKVVLQPALTAVGPNPTGSTNQSQIVATVTDANGNPVKGAVVNFNRVADPSGGSLSQASAVTDGRGQASVQFIAGPLTTASNGVSLLATVSGTSVSGAANLTVSQSALFIALGTGNEIKNVDPETYRKDWVVYVTDANGVAVPNINLTIKALPEKYGKGRLEFGTAWGWPFISKDVFEPPTVCANEDLNYNGTLDASPTTEDSNGNGRLDPGNVISVSTSGSANGSNTGTIKTDSTGRATISLIYAESYALWVRVKLRAEAIVSGTESSKEAIFWVPARAEDLNSENATPANWESPFGVNSCSARD